MKSKDQLDDRISKIKSHYKETFQKDLSLDYFLTWMQAHHTKQMSDYFYSWFCDDRPQETKYTIERIEKEIHNVLNPPVVSRETKKKTTK